MNSQFQDDVELRRALEHLMESDDPGVLPGFVGLSHDVYLHQDVCPTGLASAPLLKHLGGKLLATGLLCAFLDNGKLSSVKTKFSSP